MGILLKSVHWLKSPYFVQYCRDWQEQRSSKMPTNFTNIVDTRNICDQLPGIETEVRCVKYWYSAYTRHTISQVQCSVLIEIFNFVNKSTSKRIKPWQALLITSSYMTIGDCVQYSLLIGRNEFVYGWCVWGSFCLPLLLEYRHFLHGHH